MTSYEIVEIFECFSFGKADFYLRASLVIDIDGLKVCIMEFNLKIFS